MAPPNPPEDLNQPDEQSCWRIHRSHAYPDRFYYYNYLTGETLWKLEFGDIAGIEPTREESPDSGLFPDSSSPTVLPPARPVNNPRPSTSGIAAQHVHFPPPSQQPFQIESRNSTVGELFSAVDERFYQLPQSFQDNTNASRPVAMQSFSLPIATQPNISCCPPRNLPDWNMFYPSTQMALPAPNYRCPGMTEPPPFQAYPFNRYQVINDNDDDDDDDDSFYVPTPILYKDLREKLNDTRKIESEESNIEKEILETVNEEETVIDSTNESVRPVDRWKHELDKFVTETKITIPEAILLVENRFCLNYKPEEEKGIFYIVLDTNYLMHNLEFVSTLRTAVHQVKKDSRILVPLKVEQELRLLKENKVEAKMANQFIKVHRKDTKFSIQSSTSLSVKETRKWNNSGGVFKGDMQILLCCLELTDQGHSVVLLTNDINFSNIIPKDKMNVLRYSQVVRLLYQLQGKSRELSKTAEIIEKLDAGDAVGKSSVTKGALIQPSKLQMRPALKENDPPANTSAQPKTPKKIIMFSDAAKHNTEQTVQPKTPRKRIIFNDDEKNKLEQPSHKVIVLESCLKTPKKIVAAEKDHGNVKRILKTPRKQITFNDDETDKLEQPPHKVVVLEACPKTPKKVNAAEEDHGNVKRILKTPRKQITFNNEEPEPPRTAVILNSVQQNTARKHITFNEHENEEHERNIIVPEAVSASAQRKTFKKVEAPMNEEEEVSKPKLHKRIVFESDQITPKKTKVIEAKTDTPIEKVELNNVPAKECDKNDRIELIQMENDAQINDADTTAKCTTANNNNNWYSDEYLNNFFSDNEQTSPPKRRRKSSANGTESLPSTHTSDSQLPLVQTSQSIPKSNFLLNIELHQQTSRMNTIVEAIRLSQLEKAAEPVRDLSEGECELQETIDYIDRLSNEEYIIDQLQGWLCTVTQKLEDLLNTILMSFTGPLERYVSSWHISESLSKLAARFSCADGGSLDRLMMWNDIAQLKELIEDQFNFFTITKQQMNTYKLIQDIKSGKFRLKTPKKGPFRSTLISFYKLLYSMLKKLKVFFEDIYIIAIIEDALRTIKDIGKEHDELHDSVLDKTISETSSELDGGADVESARDPKPLRNYRSKVEKYINVHLSHQFIEDAITEGVTCEDVPVETVVEETVVPEIAKESPKIPRIRIQQAKRPYTLKKVAKRRSMLKFKNLNIKRTIRNDLSKEAVLEKPLLEQGESSQATLNLESMHPKKFLSAVISHLKQLWSYYLSTLNRRPVTNLAFTQFTSQEIEDFMTQSVANLKIFADIIKATTIGDPIPDEDAEKFLNAAEVLLKGSEITNINIEFKEIASFFKNNVTDVFNYFKKILYFRTRFRYYLRHKAAILQQLSLASDSRPQF